MEVFKRIGVTEDRLHNWAFRGLTGGTKEKPLLSPDAVQKAAAVRRGHGEGSMEETAMVKGATTRGWVTSFFVS